MSNAKNKPAKNTTPSKPASVTDKPATKMKRVTLHVHANGASFSDARPGCLAVLVARCLQATKEKPITKKELLAYMISKFADRDAAKMKSTVTGQLPSQLKGEKGIIMKQILDDSSEPPTPTGKFYFDAKATDACRKEQGRPPLNQSKQFGGKPEDSKAEKSE